MLSTVLWIQDLSRVSTMSQWNQLSSNSISLYVISDQSYFNLLNFELYKKNHSNLFTNITPLIEKTYLVQTHQQTLNQLMF